MFVRGCWVNGIRRLIVSRRGDEEEFFEIRTEWSDRSVLYLHRSLADLGRLWQRLRDAFPEDRPELARAPLRQGAGASVGGLARSAEKCGGECGNSDAWPRLRGDTRAALRLGGRGEPGRARSPVSKGGPGPTPTGRARCPSQGRLSLGGRRSSEREAGARRCPSTPGPRVCTAGRSCGAWAGNPPTPTPTQRTGRLGGAARVTSEGRSARCHAACPKGPPHPASPVAGAGRRWRSTHTQGSPPRADAHAGLISGAGRRRRLIPCLGAGPGLYQLRVSLSVLLAGLALGRQG